MALAQGATHQNSITIYHLPAKFQAPKLGILGILGILLPGRRMRRRVRWRIPCAEQMKEYDIEKTILCPAAASLNAELLDAWRQMPDRIIPLFWINANLGDPAYAELEHYLRDLGFAGVKMQPLFDGFTADSPMVDPVMEIARKYRKPVFIHCGHPPFSLP